jgi:hypothetical protein
MVKEWETVAAVTSAALAKNIDQELTNGQKEYIDVLAMKYTDFNTNQVNHFQLLLAERLEKLRNFPLLSVNPKWTSIQEKCILELK